ncbi:hypothetical protein WJX82_008681 [Trebouxia sp. C0006]
MQHSRVKHSTKSRFLDKQPTELLYTTNIGQQGTGWTVINQELWWGLRFAFDHRSYVYPALHLLTVQCPGLLQQFS